MPALPHPARQGGAPSPASADLPGAAGDRRPVHGAVSTLSLAPTQASSSGAPTENLAGLVERVTFHNEENGFCVLRVTAAPRSRRAAATDQAIGSLRCVHQHTERQQGTVGRLRQGEGGRTACLISSRWSGANRCSQISVSSPCVTMISTRS
ncbi:MAG: YrrC family ATP-dependent DNA helicase [Janthinobacterium lividum]